MAKEVTLVFYCYLVIRLTVTTVAMHFEPLLSAVSHFNIVTKTATVIVPGIFGLVLL